MTWTGRISRSEEADADERLAQRIAAGERAALEELYARYSRPLFGFLMGIAPDAATAEEILQDTLVAVWQGAAGFEGRATFRQWLFAVARRQAYNAVRRRRLPWADPAEVEAAEASGPSPEVEALTGAALDDLAARIHGLPPGQQEVLVLTLVEGFSYEETAAILEVPLGTVRSRLNTARRTLRQQLAAEMEDFA
ncbi:MAG: sigma-70 family RNA polymerase sigma factor [Chloroflexota bacterium]|nr:sigma-70 family RNA polymerase sigma factor [Chloroflexota bacterium]